MASNRDLTGTVVAITGATSGIGRETARKLVAEGALVALGGRRTDRLATLVAELGADNSLAVTMDFRSPADNARLVSAAEAVGAGSLGRPERVDMTLAGMRPPAA